MVSQRLSLSLPTGPLGLGIQKHEVTGLYSVASVGNVDVPLQLKDVILSLNGIVLADVDGGVDAVVKLFAAFASGPRTVVIKRGVAAHPAAVRAHVAYPTQLVAASTTAPLFNAATVVPASRKRPATATTAAPPRVTRVSLSPVPANGTVAKKPQVFRGHVDIARKAQMIANAATSSNAKGANASLLKVQQARLSQPAHRATIIDVLRNQPTCEASLSTIKEMAEASMQAKGEEWIAYVFNETLRQMTADGEVMRDNSKYWLLPSLSGQRPTTRSGNTQQPTLQHSSAANVPTNHASSVAVPANTAYRAAIIDALQNRPQCKASWPTIKKMVEATMQAKGEGWKNYAFSNALNKMATDGEVTKEKSTYSLVGRFHPAS